MKHTICHFTEPEPGLRRAHPSQRVSFAANSVQQEQNQDTSKCVKRADSKSSELYKCSKCGNTYRTKFSCCRHEAVCGQPKQFKCHLCTHTAIHKHHLRAHIRNVHTAFDARNYKYCGACGRKFKYTGDFNRHTKICRKTVFKNR